MSDPNVPRKPDQFWVELPPYYLEDLMAVKQWPREKARRWIRAEAARLLEKRLEGFLEKAARG